LFLRPQFRLDRRGRSWVERLRQGQGPIARSQVRTRWSRGGRPKIRGRSSYACWSTGWPRPRPCGPFGGAFGARTLVTPSAGSSARPPQLGISPDLGVREFCGRAGWSRSATRSNWYVRDIRTISICTGCRIVCLIESAARASKRAGWTAGSPGKNRSTGSTIRCPK